MEASFKKFAYSLLAASVPLTLFAFSSGPPVRRTGAPIDGGLTCAACHRGNEVNSAGGGLQIQVSPYRPAQTQTIRVTVRHPEALRWGFELTARAAADPSKKAGTFTQSEQINVRCDDPAPVSTGGMPPCGDRTEFATHNANSTMGGENGAKTFEVQWTAPDTDVGDVIFYAAGNAANNSGNNIGDRIYTSELRIENEGSCALSQRPQLRGVGNAATSESSLSMNTLMSLYGMNFALSGTNRGADGGVIRNNAFPRELACVAIEVAGQRAPVLYVSPGQINAQVPTITQTGSVPVRVIVNPGRPNELASDTATVTLQNYSPAFFTFDGQSIKARVAGATGPIIGNPATVPGARSARPGEILELYATGLGPSTPVFQAGEIVPGQQLPLREQLTVTVGGTTLAPADVLYAGVAPGSISGLYQINVRLPATLGTGNVPVRISVGGVTSPSAIIPVQQQ